MDRTQKTGKKREIRKSIKFKIFFLSLLPTVALIGAGIINHQYLNVLGASAEQILSKNYKSIRAAQETRKMLEQVRNLFLDPSLNRKSNLPVPDKEAKKIAFNLKVCKDNITEEGELELINELYSLYEKYKRFPPFMNRDRFRQLKENEAVKFLSITTRMIENIDNLVSINENAMEKAEKNTRILAKKAQMNAAILFGIIVVAILGLNYFLSGRIAKPIMELARHLSGIKEGSGHYPRIHLHTNDEIGFLVRAFNQLFSRLEQYDNYRDNIIASEREKVRRSEEAKGRFMADISHQLKTPMTSLSMSIGMLHNRGDKLSPEKRKKMFSTAHEDCTRLSSLINELVDISRLETMSMPRPKETLDIKMMIDECLAPLKKQAQKKGVSINIHVPDDLPGLTIDSFRFPWVITNLIGNAIRYTPCGGNISIKVYRQGSRFYFECADTGEGIQPEYLPHIFDRFTQFSERGKSGTVGLGLAIVKDIIEQHGGDIEVKSETGKGTAFIFWIPETGEVKNEKSAGDR